MNTSLRARERATRSSACTPSSTCKPPKSAHAPLGAAAVVAGAVLLAPAHPAGGIITTLAGGPGGPGPARAVAVTPCGLGYSGHSVYVGNSNGNGSGDAVQRVSTRTGMLTTVAGNGAGLGGGDGAAAAKVSLGSACGTAVDSAGNVLTADQSRVQAVAARTGTFYGIKMTAGHVYIVAGKSRDPGPGSARRTRLTLAVGVTVDHRGNLVIADNGFPGGCPGCHLRGSLVQVVAVRNGTFYGQKMTAGNIYTVAGRLRGPGPAGNGGPATRAWLGPRTGSVVTDHAGNLVIPDSSYERSAHIAPSVRIVAARTGTFYGQKMTAGHIYQVAGNGQRGSSGDGGPALRAPLESADGVAVDAAGNLVVADNNRVRVVAGRTGTFYGQKMTAGHIYGIAGTGHAGYSGAGGPAVRAKVTAGLVVVDDAGNVVIGDNDEGFALNEERLEAIAVRTGTFYGQKMTAGHIYDVAGNGAEYSGNGAPPGHDVIIDPGGVSSNAAGDVVFSDWPSQVIWAVMARSGTFYGRRLIAGRSYLIGGDGQTGYRGDRGPATKAAFNMGDTSDVAIDGSGDVAVADQINNRVRFIAARTGTFWGVKMTAGDVYTVAGTGVGGYSGNRGPATKAKLDDVSAVSFDHAGNLLIADFSWVRVVAAHTGTFYGVKMIAGHIYTIAGDGKATSLGDGGPATKAEVGPLGVAGDGAGNVLIADNSDRIRVVAEHTGLFYGIKMTAGDIYAIAGNGKFGFSGNRGPALKAEFGDPSGISADRNGNVAMSDADDGVVWVVAAHTGTYYGLPMTAGHIYVVAGFRRKAGHGWLLGTDGLGDGEPATRALVVFPNGVACLPSGDLLIADTDNRIRSVSG